MMMAVNLTNSITQDFDTDVFAATEPLVLVAFWSPEDDPSRAIIRFTHHISYTFKKRIRVVMIDAHEHPDLVTRFDIGSLPTFLLIANGQSLDRITTLDPMVLGTVLKQALYAISDTYIH